jgi:hypothetical protein
MAFSTLFEVKFSTIFDVLAECGELASLAESDRKIALDRYRLLRPHLEDGRTLSVVASEAGVAYSTAQRW